MADPIIIEQVANGFIVNYAPVDRAMCVDRKTTHVFESLPSLQTYLEIYFESYINPLKYQGGQC